MWHCSRLVLKNKTRWTLFTRENWASFEKNKEKLDSPFTQIGSSPLPGNATQLGRTCSRKVPGVWTRRGKIRNKMAETSSLKIIATSGKRGSVIWSKLPSHSWLPAELMLLVCCNYLNFIFVTSIQSRAAVQTGC